MKTWAAEYTEQMTRPLRWLQSEIANRMIQKLEIVKLDVNDLLVIPDFPGKHAALLSKRFPGVKMNSASESTMSAWAVRCFQLSRKLRAVVHGGREFSLDSYRQTGRIELPNDSVDLVFSDLLLQDLPDPKHFLQECWRILREGGLLTFAYLGPDTGKEFIGVPELEGSLKKLASPWDMHDMGDAVLSEGFSEPVMDMEYLYLEYESDALLIADSIALQLMNEDTRIEGVAQHLPSKMTLEVVYGHAWAIGKHLTRAKDQLAYIDPGQIQRKTRHDSN